MFENRLRLSRSPGHTLKPHFPGSHAMKSIRDALTVVPRAFRPLGSDNWFKGEEARSGEDKGL